MKKSSLALVYAALALLTSAAQDEVKERQSRPTVGTDVRTNVTRNGRSSGFVNIGTNLTAAFVPTFDPNDILQAEVDGTNSLITFKKAITSFNYHLLGFQSTNELSNATNGKPILIYPIPLEKVRAYQLTQSFETLLEAPDRVILPILYESNIRSSITLRFVATGRPWRTENWGQPKLIRRLWAALQLIPPQEVLKDTAPFLVEIAVFDIWLVGYHDPGQNLILKSTSDMRFDAVSIPRNKVLSQADMRAIATAAARYNGLPN